MRYYFFALILAFPILLTAQKADIFCIDSLPTEGVTLNKNWLFKMGDTPEFANPEFIDTSWQKVCASCDIYYLPNIPKNGEIMWLRLHLSLDSAITEQLVMTIQQVGASEMYLNGKLIHRFGVLSENRNEIKGFSPFPKPYSLPLQTQKEQVLAVRYAFQPQLRYLLFMGYTNRMHSIVVSSVTNNINAYHKNHVSSDKNTNFRLGLFVILGLLYGVFYLFYPTQKINLYFSAYTLLYALLLKTFEYHEHLENVEQWFGCYLAIMVVNFMAFMCLLTGIYQLFEQKKSWNYWLLLVLGIIGIPIGVFIYLVGWLIPMFLFILLINADILRVSIKAIRRQKKGAWIIAAGSLGVLIAWIICLLQVLQVLTFFSFDYYEDFQGIAVVSLPIAVAIFIGYNSAMTNRSLQHKLVEIEKLSKEKLQYLATQIETQQALNQERTRIARDMHDDISSGLSAINLLANYIQNTPLSTDTHLEIQHIAESSKDINQRIREIIWSVSSDSDNLDGLVNFARRYVSEFCEMQHIDSQFIAPDNLPDLTLENEVKRHLFLCVKEALNNAAKYANCTLIKVLIDVKDNEISVIISDNGIGFNVENALKNGGNGLKNIQGRMREMGGEAVFLNEKGSDIVLTCKI